MSFKDLKLIKPLLKAIDASGYTEPTLVQERTIPVILEGKDVTNKDALSNPESLDFYKNIKIL